MADAKVTTTDAKKPLSVPPEVEEKFHELVAMIKASQSMEDEERQYWVDVLPIMSQDQITNLRGILENEKKQLAEASSAYSQDMSKAIKNVASEFDEQAYLEKKRARVAAEKAHEAEEHKHEEDILSQLNQL